MAQSDTVLNSLEEWLDYISKTHPSEIEMGLDRIRRVFKKMKKLQRSNGLKPKQIVVVSGTNGKGSTIALIESGLIAMGHTVGSYTSPHIRKYNERVKINAQPISDQTLIDSFTQVDNARAGVPLTYFEFGTLAAFDVLFNSQLDVLILEIGLGGRLDAVNIIDADLSIITSVALDHTDWLGSSLEGIGFEKAGILRANGQAILGEKLPNSVSLHAKSLDCKTLTVHQDIIRNEQGVTLLTETGEKKFQGFPSIRLPENNILIAFQALIKISENLAQVSKSIFSYNLMLECFNNVKIEGRLEEVKHTTLGSNQHVFLDVGHNPHAASYLLGVLKGLKLPGMTINAVYSSLADKDVDALAKILSPVIDKWFLAPLHDDRALDIIKLESAVGGYTRNMLSFGSLHEALHSALARRPDESGLEPKSITLVFGSFYVIDAAKAYFEGL
ncbi:MAG: dihydrofolate synthase/folylpolyglutamate synthase [Oleiphilaceae bacterium]